MDLLLFLALAVLETFLAGMVAGLVLVVVSFARTGRGSVVGARLLLTGPCGALFGGALVIAASEMPVLLKLALTALTGATGIVMLAIAVRAKIAVASPSRDAPRPPHSGEPAHLPLALFLMLGGFGPGIALILLCATCVADVTAIRILDEGAFVVIAGLILFRRWTAHRVASSEGLIVTAIAAPLTAVGVLLAARAGVGFPGLDSLYALLMVLGIGLVRLSSGIQTRILRR